MPVNRIPVTVLLVGMRMNNNIIVRKMCMLKKIRAQEKTEKK